MPRAVTSGAVWIGVGYRDVVVANLTSNRCASQNHLRFKIHSMGESSFKSQGYHTADSAWFKGLKSTVARRLRNETVVTAQLHDHVWHRWSQPLQQCTAGRLGPEPVQFSPTDQTASPASSRVSTKILFHPNLSKCYPQAVLCGTHQGVTFSKTKPNQT